MLDRQDGRPDKVRSDRFHRLNEELTRILISAEKNSDVYQQLFWIQRHLQFFTQDYKQKSKMEHEEELNALVFLLSYLASPKDESSIFSEVKEEVDLGKMEKVNLESYEQIIQQGLKVMKLALAGKEDIRSDQAPFLEAANPKILKNYDKVEEKRQLRQQISYTWYWKLQDMNKRLGRAKLSARLGTPLCLIPGVFFFMDMVPSAYRTLKKEGLKGIPESLKLLAFGLIATVVSPVGAFVHYTGATEDVKELERKIDNAGGLNLSTPTVLVKKTFAQENELFIKDQKKPLKPMPNQGKIYNKPKKANLSDFSSSQVNFVMDAAQAERFDKWKAYIKLNERKKQLSPHAKAAFFKDIKDLKAKSRESGKIVARVYERRKINKA